MIEGLKRRVAAAFPVVEQYEGPEGRAWLAQVHRHVPHLAGMTAARGRAGRTRIPKPMLHAQALAAARSGAFAAIGEKDEFGRGRSEAVRFPAYVMQDAELPPTVEALRAKLPGSSVSDEWRRIRNAAMTWRVVNDSAALRRFYDEMFRPHMIARHGAAAHIESFARMHSYLDNGGELLCIYCGGVWVAACFTIRHPDKLVIGWIGLAHEAPRAASAALYLFAMERAIELGLERIGLGRSLPFLGPGVARYKAKWGGAIRRDPYARAVAHAYIDLARPEMRGLLARQPMVVDAGPGLAVVQWIPPDGVDPAALRADIARFAGIDRWILLGAAGDLERAALGDPRTRLVPVDLAAAQPLWLGEILAGALADR